MAKLNVKSSHATHATDFIKADSEQAVFFGNPMIDGLFSAVSTLSAELWASRRRTRITEKLMETNDKVTRDMIEQYVPTAEETAAWNTERDRFVRMVFDPFMRQSEIPYASALYRRPDPGK